MKTHPRTFEQFKSTRYYTHSSNLSSYCDDTESHLLAYYGEIHINLIHTPENIEEAPLYMLILENSYFHFDTLEEAEQKVFDWYKYHFCPLTYDEIENDLHERGAQLVKEMGINTSLDEINLDILSNEYKRRVKYLLNEFEQLNENF